MGMPGHVGERFLNNAINRALGLVAASTLEILRGRSRLRGHGASQQARCDSRAATRPRSSSAEGWSKRERSRTVRNALSALERASANRPVSLPVRSSLRPATVSSILTALSICPTSSWSSRAIRRCSSSWACRSRADSRCKSTAVCSSRARCSWVSRRSRRALCRNANHPMARLMANVSPNTVHTCCCRLDCMSWLAAAR